MIKINSSNKFRRVLQVRPGLTVLTLGILHTNKPYWQNAGERPDVDGITYTRSNVPSHKTDIYYMLLHGPRGARRLIDYIYINMLIIVDISSLSHLSVHILEIHK